ncbi:hypothetical protein AVEN_138445-1 [Araneus ventricosus]|uniref:Uncharacterized protein n=1 Tax=Araneus ventricosus TaxID=182803 RepID=A0A4Y2CDA3_ARAVE|nr:hypothetical protein AVEN_138445-1 [Araneus ventricosus]
MAPSSEDSTYSRPPHVLTVTVGSGNLDYWSFDISILSVNENHSNESIRSWVMKIISGSSFPEILSNRLDQVPPQYQPEALTSLGSDDTGIKGLEFRHASTWQSNVDNSSKLQAFSK